MKHTYVVVGVVKMKKSNVEFIISRTANEVVIRIVNAEGKDIIEPIHLQFFEALKLGKILISNARAGMMSAELLLKKFAQVEHEVRKLHNKIHELEKTIKKQEEVSK